MAATARPVGPASAPDRGAGPRDRQCGRCRRVFDGDPTLNPVAMPEWWLCSSCRASLLGDRSVPAIPDGEPHAP